MLTECITKQCYPISNGLPLQQMGLFIFPRFLIPYETILSILFLYHHLTHSQLKTSLLTSLRKQNSVKSTPSHSLYLKAFWDHSPSLKVWPFFVKVDSTTPMFFPISSHLWQTASSINCPPLSSQASSIGSQLTAFQYASTFPSRLHLLFSFQNGKNLSPLAAYTSSTLTPYPLQSGFWLNWNCSLVATGFSG